MDADLIRRAHGNLPKNFVMMTPTEAELAKYFVNCFNAYRVNFANAFYDVCGSLGANYSTIKDAVTKRSGIAPDYLTANEQTRGFGGACLPKDTEAFAMFVADLKLPSTLFKDIVVENNLFIDRPALVRRDEVA
jgi:UDP-glucose 6-dehydrogenase